MALSVIFTSAVMPITSSAENFPVSVSSAVVIR